MPSCKTPPAANEGSAAANFLEPKFVVKSLKDAEFWVILVFLGLFTRLFCRLSIIGLDARQFVEQG